MSLLLEPANAPAAAPGLAEIGFEFSAEATLLLDPVADRILDANPAACALLGFDRALLRQTKISALHAGQLPALIVFTQAVLAKGSLLDPHADAAPCRRARRLQLEYAGSRVLACRRAHIDRCSP